MKYALISGFADEIAGDVDTQFRVLGKLGIGYFEPRGIDGKNIANLTDEEVERLKGKMKACGIKASSIGSPIGKVKLEEDFEGHFRQFQRVVEIAGQLGAKYIRMFSFYHEGGAEWTEGERAEVLSRLGRMIAYAAERDVVLLHENEKDIYGDTAERCADLMEELGCGHFRAVFDPANFVQCGQDTWEAFEKLKGHIAYLHIKDALLADGRVVPAGVGDGNVERILRSLLETGYDGFLSLEPHLGSFDGLKDLELDDKMLNLPPGGEGTFTLAFQALEGILERIL
ncbi:MAG: sugar phosphate isomerase/epimerase [Lachnospiraceae bacterium]|uniref:sugar phosphate isomerase/epimerase family protein n=1 Tax=uncultured Acetatifactor sp. TaxID=1671927 RepID=UPI002632DF36|nr:sugar phosphate isomerase/epimerase family protein [uncultured Acetatifactor sp.]MCI8788771.1 sugar phosphate isomerase/epimerase [Lachnospiraceae bacterium]